MPANGEGISTAALAVSTSTNGLVQLDLVARGDEPFHDRALLEALAEVRHHEHALGHQYATAVRAAAAILSTLGR